MSDKKRFHFTKTLYYPKILRHNYKKTCISKLNQKMQGKNRKFSGGKPDSVWFRGHFEICKLGFFTGQNRLGYSSYLIQDIKMYPCVKFGACITIRTLHRLSISTTLQYYFYSHVCSDSSEIRRPVGDLSFDSWNWADFDLNSAPLSSYLREFRLWKLPNWLTRIDWCTTLVPVLSLLVLENL